MDKVQWSRTSRYKEVPSHEGVFMEDDEMLYPDPTDTQVIVRTEEAGRLDRVASRVYNNPLLWWALARRNGIENPLKVEPGDKLYVPTIQRIYSKGGVLTQ